MFIEARCRRWPLCAQYSVQACHQPQCRVMARMTELSLVCALLKCKPWDQMPESAHTILVEGECQ